MYSQRSLTQTLRPGRRGFSLVEALVALTIMALAGSVLLLSVESSLETTTDAVDRTIADGIAQQVLDQALTEKYTESAGSGLTLLEILGPLGPAADELLGVGTSLFDDVDDYAGYIAQPVKDEYGEVLGTGDDSGGLRSTTFRIPSGFFQQWRYRVKVYYVDASDHRTESSSATAYRAIEVFVEKLGEGGRVIPLASRKRIVTYLPPPTS